MHLLSVLLVVSLQHITNGIITYDVVSNGSNNGSNIKSLDYYLNNTSKYFSSFTQLVFKPGKHYLNADIIVQNVISFSMLGEGSCKVSCILYSSIMLFNVTDFTLENINFENCNKNHSDKLHTTFDYDYISISKPSRNASIFLYNCTSVVINNISVSVNAGTTGILVVNVKSYSSLNNVSITVNYTICPMKDEHPEQINGILLYYDYWNNKTTNTNLQLDNFQFTAKGLCSHPLQYVITLFLFQKNISVSIVIRNTDFRKLKDVSVLYYYGETCGVFASNNLTFINCMIYSNTGHLGFKMLEIILYNQGCFDSSLQKLFCSQQYNNISFRNCKFVDNHNITSMIHIKPASSRAITGYIYVINSLFHTNYNTHFLNIESDTDNVWQLSNLVCINTMNISSNRHSEGNHLLSVTNGWMRFTGIVFITNNSFYKNIIKLHISAAIFEHNITIINNTARQILEGSYILITENTKLDVSFNTVYMVIKQTLTLGISTRPVCGVQFYSEKGNLDSLNGTGLPFKVIAVNNTHMISKSLLGKSFSSSNCQWLAGTAFHTRNSVDVYNKTFYVNNLVVGNEIERPVPLSICKCENSSPVAKSVDCYSPYLGSIFPGETLIVQLSLQEQWISHINSSRTIIVKNSDQDDCSIVHTSELSQTHFNSLNNCNNYSYTLWPKNETIKECKLFIGLINMPEMFYVQVKPCPKGFTFQKQRKACYCDPLLNNKVLSNILCNLKNETILRPANSWIYADTDNKNIHTYKVSLYCPFDHCLPKSSDLNLSNPDSQCQFNRTGVLCGECKSGLSVVLGTPQCKICSDIYLLLLIPVAIIVIAFIIVLYIFNLTVRNGTINTLIFYVNIVNINILTLFPGCQSITCIIFSHLNFDFRTKSCFYNGMDDYAKEWLHLLHTFSLSSIAILFIVLSRYSAKIQRLTAQRALPVLATMILFTYAKSVLTVCNVLFRYSTVTHLPSNKTELVWSISTTTPLFGVKFLAFFTFCVFLLLILLPFNVILLFTRKLSHISLVMKLKPLLDAYFSAYKDNAYYWTGLLLLIRVIVYILSAFGNDITFLSTSVLFTGLLCLHGVIQPFKSQFYNIQESVMIANLLAAHVAPLYKKDLVGLKVAKILLAIGIIYFIIVIVFHCFMHRWEDKIYKCIKWIHRKICKTKKSQELHSIQMESLSSRIADVTYNYKEFQEPLVEYEK